MIVLLLCTITVIFAATWLYRSDLFTRGEPEPVESASQEAPEPPDPGPAESVEGLQLDAPEPDPEPPAEPKPQPDPKPEPKPPPRPSLKAVEGDNFLALVTKQTTLGRYAPDDLELIPAGMVHPDRRKGRYYLRREPLEHLKRMWEAAQGDGVLLTVTSAYRSYDTQKNLFASYAARDGEAKAATYSARAGQSEHQLGTTLDFNINKTAGAEQHAWLADNAHHHGFAMSYPRGKEQVTGYVYEPWHYRYIGVEAAEEWKCSGLPLCVYLEQKQ